MKGVLSSHRNANYLFEYYPIKLDIGITKNQFQGFKHFVNGKFPVIKITWTIWPDCFFLIGLTMIELELIFVNIFITRDLRLS